MIEAMDVTAALRDLGIRPDDTIFVHSGLQRAGRVAGRTTEDKLGTLLKGLREAVPNGTLMMPTFTYSYCNDALFDVEETPSTVGQLTEFFRRQDATSRTTDPIFSTAFQGPVPRGWAESLLKVRDHDCFGTESVYRLLLDSDAVICFLGTAFDFCTFVHHVEQERGVPYRYFKDFQGLTRLRGDVERTCARFFVRDLEADVITYLKPLETRLRAAGAMADRDLGHGFGVSAVRARSVRQELVAAFEDNPDFLLRRGHQEESR